MTLLLSPKVTFSGESGSETGDGLTYRGIAGYTYSVNIDLVIATTRIEDYFIVFPGVVLNRRINERTVLSSIITNVRTEPGPRISLKYFLNRNLSGSVSTGYEFRRFRLDDDGVAPDGVGDIKLMPLWLTVGYSVSETLKADFTPARHFWTGMGTGF